MQFEFSVNSLDKTSADAILVFAFQDEKGKSSKFNLLKSAENVDKVLGGILLKTLEIAKFTGKRGESFSFFPQDKFLAKRIIVLGLGKKDEFIADDLRRAVGSFTSKMKKKISSAALELPSEDETSLAVFLTSQMIGEGIMLGGYEFTKYKTKENADKEFSTVIISGKLSADVKKGLEKAKLYADATILARDLVNEQAAIATPTYLADLALSIAKKDPKHISCRVFGKEEARKLGMEAFLGIAKAADTKVEPKLIFLEYTPDKASKMEKLAIVGKGITFDSGGINVKGGDHMQDMKMDMAGGAIVLSVFSVISEIKPQFSVIGVVAATPNLISATSLVPGDVVRAMNGKTIEILDTDAEGRVTLADSLSFAVKQGATKILDFATLTGACMVALGIDITGLFSNNHDLTKEIKAAASAAGEKMWELPLEKEYKKMNKSDVADIANIPSSRYGGAITAALFLEEFIDNKPWAHMDIAGPAFAEKSTDIGPKGGTGHGVRTVLNLLS